LERPSKGGAQWNDPGDPRVIEAVEVYLAALESGNPPDRNAYLAEHHEIAGVLAECLDALRFVHTATPRLQPQASEPASNLDLLQSAVPLGDFQIIREVGRGGMGVVYEAIQLSLGRHVALKVLPFAAALDVRQLQRFKNEAQAAAQLHHTNIIPVFDVGTDRGVHYYAMQYIEGQTLAALIKDMRRHAGLEEDEPLGVSPSTGDNSGQTVVALTTEHSHTSHSSFRRITQLGIQAAEALQYAHDMNVIHRDIKPANLLVDTQGNLWVTDFGLAQAQTDTRLTLTGDMVGTLRYMSPEQALAQPVGVDHRSDLYSLGATLYELLTLEPAFNGRCRQELLRQITFDEPKPLRRINKAVPVELETIVLKAIAKSPAERYATAEDLADDMRRFLADQPIRARRPSWLDQTRKWTRRHRPVVWSSALAFLVSLTVLAGCVGWVVRDRAARRGKIAVEVEAALEYAQLSQKEGKWTQAQVAANRAEALIQGAGTDPRLAERVHRLLQELAEEEADRRIVDRLEELRLLQAEVKGDSYSLERALPDYRTAFENYGLLPAAMTAEEASSFLRRKPGTVFRTLVAALDHWLILARYKKAPEAAWLERVLVLSDSDAWRQRLRSARQNNDRHEMEQLARDVEAASQPPEELFLLHLGLRQRGAKEGAISLLQRAQDAFPSDFWINHDLGMALHECRPPRNEEAIRFLTVAVALRPESAGARLNLGTALLEQGRFDEAVLAFRKAIECKHDYAMAHNNLGIALVRTGELEEAVASFARAVELRPNYAEACCNLGCAFMQQGALNEALVAIQRGHDLASRLPDWPHPSAEWVRECQRLIELDRRLPAAIKGETQPVNAVERCEYARLCFFKKRYRAAAQFWADTFEADPGLATDRTSRQRYAAACAAALASAKQGVDAGEVADNERTHWRQQSIKWLQADLDACHNLLKNGRPEDRRMVLQELQRWHRDPNLAGLRDPSDVATMRADEQEECKHLWAEVDALINMSDLLK
jgi:serine/threonine protein kinase/Flp pilus assembly protein TadD